MEPFASVSNLANLSVDIQLGLIDTLVNNAGMVDAQWAIKQDEALIDGVIDTNLVGPYLLSNEVARRLIKSKKPGRMVNISSMAAFNTCLLYTSPSPRD